MPRHKMFLVPLTATLFLLAAAPLLHASKLAGLYVIKQESFGSFALAWAWLLYLLFASAMARFLYVLTRRFFKKKLSAEEAFFKEGESGDLK